MADEKVNVSPEERKTPEAPAPSGPGDPPAPEHTEGPATYVLFLTTIPIFLILNSFIKIHSAPLPTQANDRLPDHLLQQHE